MVNKHIVSYIDFPKPYYSCAIFLCSNCGYRTDVYSMEEYVSKSKVLCSSCGENKDGANFLCIYKNDISPNIPLHIQVANLEGDKGNKCFNCLQVKQIHWIEFVVHCENYERASMYFSEFTNGENIEEFKRYATKCTEDYPPILVEYSKDGFEYTEVKDEFSAN